MASILQRLSRETDPRTALLVNPTPTAEPVEFQANILYHDPTDPTNTNTKTLTNDYLAYLSLRSFKTIPIIHITPFVMNGAFEYTVEGVVPTDATGSPLLSHVFMVLYQMFF